MTQTFTLMPVPKWYIADLVGKPLGSGYLAAFSSLNPVSERAVYMDASTSLPWPRVAIPNQPFTGILFDENGSQGPFYFLFDSTQDTNLYYLAVYDADGVLQWDINNFDPSPGSGGGSVITNVNNIQNQVINSPMWRHVQGTTPVVTTASQFLLVAPGAHAALSSTTQPGGASDYVGPDIVFLKGNTTSTDSISFPLFAPNGANFFGLDAQPPDYFNYTCTVAGTSENTKCVQFPILNNVANLANKSVTITIWAKSSTSSDLSVKWKQFFGDGGGSATVNPTITTFNLTPVWAKYPITTVIPDITGKTLGSCGNSGLFLQVEMQHDVTTSTDFTVPRIYLGTAVPIIDFENYDVIDSTINTPRTGDVKQGFATSAIPGYLLMNDLTIGDPTSGSTNRANNDTFQLFNLLWTNVTSQTGGTNAGGTGYAQLYDSSGAPLATVGASAVADFTAHKRLSLTRQLGRVLGGAGAGSGLTARALGEYLGEQSHFIQLSEIPDHQHNRPLNGGSYLVTGSLNPGAPQPGNGQEATETGNITGYGAYTALSLMQPSSFMNFFIKL